MQEANGSLEGNVMQMWQGIKGMVTNTAQGGDTGVATLRGVSGGLVSSGKRKRDILAGHYKRRPRIKLLTKCLRRRWTHGPRTKKRHRR